MDRKKARNLLEIIVIVAILILASICFFFASRDAKLAFNIMDEANSMCNSNDFSCFGFYASMAGSITNLAETYLTIAGISVYAALILALILDILTVKEYERKK